MHITCDVLLHHENDDIHCKCYVLFPYHGCITETDGVLKDSSLVEANVTIYKVENIILSPQEHGHFHMLSLGGELLLHFLTGLVALEEKKLCSTVHTLK